MAISGILEHILFALYEKGIEYEISVLGPQQGLQEQIIIKYKDTYIYIEKHPQRLTYHLASGDNPKKQASKKRILAFINKKLS